VKVDTYLRVTVAGKSVTVRMRDGETFTDAMDRGVVEVLDVYGIRHATDVHVDRVTAADYYAVLDGRD